MRLIDADALWKQMEEYDDYMGSKGAHDLNVIHRDSILFAIEQAPTIDAVPVVHGEWHEENRRPRSAQFVCSVCHRTAYDIQPTRNKAWRKRCRYAYCPNCGADMRAEQ